MQAKNGIHDRNQKPTENGQARAVVVGGGLAGLAAASLLARAGLQVDLYEGARQIGGRATSQVRDAYILNLGPHALYIAGSGLRVLRALGVEPQGRKPRYRGHLVQAGRLHPLPIAPWAWMTTRLLTWPGKLDLMQALLRAYRTDPAALGDISVQTWLEQLAGRAETRELLQVLNRVSTYGNQPELQSAAAAAAQWRRGQQGVLYLDGGWQSLVDGLHGVAQNAGVRIHTRNRVEAIERSGENTTLSLEDGRRQVAATVILAVSPRAAEGLLRPVVGRALDGWLPRGPAVRMSSLDVALSRLPNPERVFALGVDMPLYYSAHSDAAQLAPTGGAVVHVGKYLAAEEAVEASQARAQLEEMLDRLQPGWRAQAVHQRFLPEMVVSHTLDLAGDPLLGKATSAVPGLPGVYVAGDWVGLEGMLADAALASAETAALRALADLQANSVGVETERRSVAQHTGALPAREEMVWPTQA